MTKRSWLTLAWLTAAAAAGFTACSDSSAPRGSGTVVVKLTDAPFPLDSIKSVDIFVVRIDARQAEADETEVEQTADDAEAETDGWTTLANPNASIDLLKLQSGTTTTLGQTALAAGSYAGFRLVIDPTKSSITLKNGQVLNGASSPGVTFPSASRSGIKIQLDNAVEIAEGGTTTMVVDFDVGSSFVMRGNSISQNGLLFKPVVQATAK